ncbi:MAG TPA: ATP-binding protein [Acidimicrobiales bacterium]|nr:ATP-binding protein [Acidimicrobiales bacterium]
MNLISESPDTPFHKRHGRYRRRPSTSFWGRLATGVRPIRRTTALPSGPSSPSVARAFVRDVLSGWGLTELEADACLVASELVTNGLRHGGGAESITLTANNRYLQVAVADRVAMRSPRRLYQDLTAEGGRGIALVEAVADTWGTTRPRARQGKAVWCKLKL